MKSNINPQTIPIGMPIRVSDLKQQIVLEILELIKNADDKMIVDGITYRSPREYTIKLIEKHYGTKNL